MNNRDQAKWGIPRGFHIDLMMLRGTIKGLLLGERLTGNGTSAIEKHLTVCEEISTRLLEQTCPVDPTWDPGAA